MARLRDKFAGQVWLKSVQGDRTANAVTIWPERANTVENMLKFLLGVPSLAVVFDSLGTLYSVRMVKSSGQHGDALDLPAASYFSDHLEYAVEAGYNDYLAICGGATWTAVGGKEWRRGIVCQL